LVELHPFCGAEAVDLTDASEVKKLGGHPGDNPATFEYTILGAKIGDYLKTSVIMSAQVALILIQIR
jgi:hypothetical protein